jgi:thiamine-phosphate pyrophosphorylase
VECNFCRVTCAGCNDTVEIDVRDLELPKGQLMPIIPTPAVERALVASGDWANRLGHVAPTSLHFFLALLDDEEGRACQLIIQAGLPIQVGRERLMAIDPGQTVHAPEELLSIAKTVCREVAGDDNCRSEHVLLAVLDGEPAIRAGLERAGLRSQEIGAAIRSEVGPPLTLDEPLELDQPAAIIDTARIIDASANRAREASRVVEDYCRFNLNDALLCREAKEIRHALTESLERARFLPQLQSRDTLRDVGTAISTVDEFHRESPLAVAQTNLKRLQEALRSLEEYGKVVADDIGRTMERLRYRAYTLEKAVVSRAWAGEKLKQARLYLLVTGSACATSLEFLIEEAVAGGVDIIQLREKKLSDRELLSRARRVRQLTRKAGSLLIVNDRPDIARLSEADGVHLGQDDVPIPEARRIVGAEALIGISTHSIDQVRQAVMEGASYIGVGPVFPSATKPFADFPGLDFVRKVSEETTLPAFALGGINPQNASEVLAAGATRIAVSSAIGAADEPRMAAAQLRRML